MGESEIVTGMMKTRNMMKVGCLAGIVLAIAGCARPDPYAAVPCPAVGVLADAREITRFRHGGGRDVADMTWHGEISTVEFSCYKPEGKDIVVGEAVIVATFHRGLAATGARQIFELFSVMSEREDRIVDKATFSVDVKFKDGQKTATATKTIRRISVPIKGAVAPELYNVYFGFQLSPAEVAYNRTKERS